MKNKIAGNLKSAEETEQMIALLLPKTLARYAGWWREQCAVGKCRALLLRKSVTVEFVTSMDI
jgi:hypothetical protein